MHSLMYKYMRARISTGFYCFRHAVVCESILGDRTGDVTYPAVYFRSVPNVILRCRSGSRVKKDGIKKKLQTM